MKNVISAHALILLAVLLAVSSYGHAAIIETSWVFRSQVTQNQSVWGALPVSNLTWQQNSAIQTGTFQGTGASVKLLADYGTVTGSVLGHLTVKHESRVHGLGKKNITLNYNGINDASRINSTWGLQVTVTPRLQVDMPWLLGDVILQGAINVVNINPEVQQDFTTGLGQLVTGTGKHEIAAIGADIAIASVGAKVRLQANTFFTPKSIVGTVSATHMATRITTTKPVTIITDGTDLAVEIDLDKSGGWEISLDDFMVDDNAFRQTLGAALEIDAAFLPTGTSISVSLALGIPFLGREFPLRFDTHGYYGNNWEPSFNLGRFCMYVEAPEPATMSLLTIGGIAMLRRRRRA